MAITHAESGRSRSGQPVAKDLHIRVEPQWVCGDIMDTLASAPAGDFIVSCPPYGDLEKYNADPSNLSVMEWHTYRAPRPRAYVIFRERYNR